MAKEARIEILKGNDAGAQFRVTGARVRFGRAADSDIVVTDSSASRNHAELVKANESFVIKDLNSSNGVFVNGKKIKEHYLVSGDIFSIGNHEYRYVERDAVQINTNETYSMRNQEGGTIPGISSSSLGVNVPVSSSGGGSKKKRLIIYGAVIAIVFGILFLLPGEDKTKKEAVNPDGTVVSKDPSKTDEFMSEDEDQKFKRKIPDEDRELFDRANESYFQGQREFRLRNYSRALEEFRKAVSFYPQHVRARTAAGQTMKKIEEESQRYLAIGKKLYAQKRYDDAIRNFNEVINLNVRQPDSTFFKESDKWKTLAEKRKGEVFEQ